MTRPMEEHEHRALFHEIQTMLYPFDVPYRMAVLADLVALTLAGWQGSDGPAIRNEELERFIQLVRDLIPMNEKLVMERAETKGSA